MMARYPKAATERMANPMTCSKVKVPGAVTQGRSFIRGAILLCFLVTTQLLFGQSTWSSGTTYSTNQWVYYNHSAYSSLQNSNTNHQPDTSATFWAPAVIVYNTKGSTQTNIPITLGRITKVGEIDSSHCLRPVIGGTAVTAGNWQDDWKVTSHGNSWPTDGSRKFGRIAFNATITSGSYIVVTFQSGTCDNTGYMSQSDMTTALSTDASMVVNPLGGGTGKTIALTTILGHTDPASAVDGGNLYWSKGPVETCVVAQDRTGTFTYDFGWHLSGGSMLANAGSAFTTTSQYASLHPWFVACFYPINSSIKVDFLLSNTWLNRGQDQIFDTLLFKTGSTTKYTYVGKMQWAKNWRKTFWIGTQPYYRIDHNWRYLRDSKAFLNYTENYPANPEYSSCASQGMTSYTTDWIAGGDLGDLGDIGGLCGMDPDFAGDDEIAPVRVEDLRYLETMDTCGTANGSCAKAWDMLTGEVHPIDNLLSAGAVVGGGGAWYNYGNVNFHMNEDRTSAGGVLSNASNFFYCPNVDPLLVSPGTHTGKNSDPTNTVTCGSGSGLATGRPLSSDTHSDTGRIGPTQPGTLVGDISSDFEIAGMDHWLDYAFPAYLLTGDYWEREEVFQEGSAAASRPSPDPYAHARNSFFSFGNPNGSITRTLGGTLETLTHAAFVAGDGTPEASYYASKLASNVEVIEGFFGITGTPLTPSDTSCSATSVTNYPDFRAANRWNWGACTVRSVNHNTTTQTVTTVPNHLHFLAAGSCPILSSGDALAGVNPTKSSAYLLNWAQNAAGIMLLQAREMGFSWVTSAATENGKQLIEMIQLGNPYLVALGNAPARDPTLATACNGTSGQNKDDFFTTYTALHNAAWANHSTIASVPISTLSCSGGIVTATTGSGHDWGTGDVVTITGAIPSGYNVTDRDPGIVATNVDPNSGLLTSFQYHVTSCPGAYVSGGTATVRPADSFRYIQSVGNGPCGNHSYSDIARGHGALLKDLGVTSAVGGCSGGVCTADAAWAFLAAQVPTLTNSPTNAPNCTTFGTNGDTTIKFAFEPRGGASSPTVTSYTLSGVKLSGAKVQ